jgi:hypothetical protein
VTDIEGMIERLIESARLRVLAGPEENAGAPLCSNLHEYDVRLEQSDFDLIEEVALTLGIGNAQSSFLEELITD